MGKNDGSGASIYGNVPDPPKEPISDAMDNANKYFSNKINGPTSCKDVEYDPENGK